MSGERVAVREFESGDEDIFRRLNEEWIRHYFEMEKKDEALFGNPRETILGMGGRIFFAVRGERVLGCCALLARAPGEFELAKMAVTRSARGSGVGRFLLETIVAEAKASGARRLYLETNHVLTAAVHLYQAVGFRKVPPERVTPSPYARAEVYMELDLR